MKWESVCSIARLCGFVVSAAWLAFFLAAETVDGSNSPNSPLPQPVELVADADTLGAARGTSYINNPDLFNERGYRNSESYRRVTEMEQISNFNGNLTIKIPLFHNEGPDDLDLDIALVYNGSAPHARFDTHDPTGDHFEQYYTSFTSIPAWFISVNGFLVFPVSSNLLLVNPHDRNDPLYDYAHSNRSNLIVGYGISDLGYMTGSPPPRAHNLVVALEDGSPLELRNITTDGPRYGFFAAAEPGATFRAHRSSQGECGVSALVMDRPDGTNWYFKDICLAQDFQLTDYLVNGSGYTGPLALRLDQIRDRGGSLIRLSYLPFQVTGLPLEHLELAPRAIEVTFDDIDAEYQIWAAPIIGNWAVPYPIWVERRINGAPTEKWKIQVAMRTARPPGETAYEPVHWYVIEATDPDGRKYLFDYEDDDRVFEYGPSCLETYPVIAKRVTAVRYPTGGRTEYTYYGPDDCAGGDCEPPECTTSETHNARFQDGFWKETGRSIWQTNIVKRARRFLRENDTDPVQAIEYYFDWSDDDAGAVVPSAPWDNWRLDDTRYRYQTVVETTNGLILASKPSGSGRDAVQGTTTHQNHYLYRKYPYNRSEDRFWHSQWATRLVRAINESSGSQDRVQRFVYDEDIGDEVYQGSLKPTSRTTRRGNGQTETGPSYQETWTYEPEFFLETSRTDPLNVETRTTWFRYVEDWEYDEPTVPPNGNEWYVASFPLTEEEWKDGEKISAVERVRSTAQFVPVSRLISERTWLGHTGDVGWETRTFTYSDPNYTLKPTLVTGPGNRTVENSYAQHVVGGHTMNGFGLVPTRVKRARFAGDSAPITTYWNFDRRRSLLTARIDENGHWYGYNYDPLGRLESIVDEGARTIRSHTYDDQAASTSISIDVYHAEGQSSRTTHRVDGLDRVFRIDQGTQGTANFRRTQHEFDILDQIHATLDPENRETEFHRDNLGRLVLEVNADNTEVATRYETWSSWSGQGIVYPFSSGTFGEVSKVENEEEEETVRVSDARDQLRAVAQYGTGSSVLAAAYYDYDDAGRLSAIRDPIGDETNFTYDAGGRVTEISHPDERQDKTTAVSATWDGEKVPYVLDEKQFIAYGTEATYSYVINDARALRASQDVVYDPVFRIREVGGADLVLIHTPDTSGSGSLALTPGQTYEISAKATELGTHVAGSISYQGLGGGRRFVYDNGGLLRFSRHPRLSDENGSDTWVYHKYDRLDRETETGLLVGVSEATLWSNVLTESYPTTGTALITRTYDSYGGWSAQNALGRLVRVHFVNPGSNQSETRLLSYDTFGNVAREDVTQSGVTGTFRFDYTHDWTGRLTECQVTPPSGTAYEAHTGYTYFGEIDWVGPTASGVDSWVGFAYRPSGRVYEVRHGTSHITYERALWTERDWIDMLVIGHGTTASLLNESYRYAPDGNLIGTTRAGEEVLAYEYDALNRLVGVDRAHDGGTVDADWSVTYDASGNRMTQVTERELSTYNYMPGGHRLLEVAPDGPGPRIAWGYNVDGSVSSRSEEIVFSSQSQPTESQEFTYNWQDRVTELRVVKPVSTGQPDAETIVSYDYDAAGREIKRSEGTKVTRYVRDAWGNVRAELDASGAVQCWWVVPGKGGGPEIAGGGQDGARMKTPLVVLDSTQEPVAYLHPDRIGTVRRVTSSDGDELLRLDTLPFGEKLRREETVPGGLSTAESKALGSAFGIGFAGQREEEASEGLRFEARWYDATTGRFTQIDPVHTSGLPPSWMLENPQFLGSYTYASSNPLKHTDPDGRVLDTLLDLGSFGYSVWVLMNEPNWINAGAAGGDLVAMMIPGVTGAGPLIRAAGKADDAIDATRAAKNGETAATAAGRAAHKAWQPPPGFAKEFRLPSGRVADAVNMSTREVIELKPNNPRAIREGQRQVERYVKELEEMTGSKWTGRVESY